jgi:outer membrane PBP1 activator LpoA protein
VLPTLATEQQNIQSRPERLALLLPMSGRIKATSIAIRDGFIAAHYASPGNRKKIHFKIYDTSSGNISSVYNKAVSDGAQMIIGPLRKRNVQQLADSGDLKVPVLALNVIPSRQDGSPPNNMYFFGLSPEDEARQIAERAIFVNKLRAVVFVPNTPWGGRVQRAFTERYKELGGKVVEAATYQPSASDFSKDIKKLLNLDDSKSRFYSLRRTLRTKMEFAPSRRSDAEFLFVAGFARQIRLIAPQLKFHQARDLPIYATSHVYTGVEDVRRDNDMNGIIFCDTPWNLSGKDNMHPIKKSIAENWPGRLYGLSRLFALGADAYNVVPYLTWLKSQPYERYTGQTGMLSVDKNQRIRRTLQWAKFDKGKATILQERINVSSKQSSTQQPAN